MLKSSSRNQRHKTTHAAPPGGVVVPGKHTQNPPQTQLNLQQAHPPVRRPITIPPMKAETIPAPVTSSPKDAPPKRPCLSAAGAYGMVSRCHPLLEPRGFDWTVLRYRSNHETGNDHRPEKPGVRKSHV